MHEKNNRLFGVLRVVFFLLQQEAQLLQTPNPWQSDVDFYENQHKWNENLGVNKTLNTEERLKNQLPIKLIKSGCSHLHISHQNIRNRKTVKILLVLIIIIKNPCGMWAHSKIRSRNQQRYYNSKNWPGKEKTGIVILLQSAMRSWSLLQPLWAAASARAPKVGKVPYDLLMSWRAILSWKYLFL